MCDAEWCCLRLVLLEPYNTNSTASNMAENQRAWT